MKTTIDWDFARNGRVAHAWDRLKNGKVYQRQLGEIPTTLCGITKPQRGPGIIYASDPRCPKCSEIARSLIAARAALAEGGVK